MISLVVLFDFSKAFDLVDHFALLSCMRKLGFSGEALKLCHSYLTGRKHAVINEQGLSSSFKSVSSGVPQGSPPDPILFAIVINTINEYLKFFNYHIISLPIICNLFYNARQH